MELRSPLLQEAQQVRAPSSEEMGKLADHRGRVSLMRYGGQDPQLKWGKSSKIKCCLVRELG